MQCEICSVKGLRIWDSRGRPTVEVEIRSAGGEVARGIAPAGASRGSGEAVDLRDGGKALGGFGVERALQNIKGPIAQALLGRDAMDQEGIDAALIELDGTPEKSRLGGNAMIAASMAVLHLAAQAAKEPLWRYLAAGREVSVPLPEIQIFGGGAHAGRRVDIQDFLVMPMAAGSFAEATEMVAEVYHAAGNLMQELGRRSGIADEGGWWPAFENNEEALQLLTRSIERAGYAHGEVMISLDIAASEFGRNGRYRLSLERREYDTGEWLDSLLRWIESYPIVSIEDPFAEDDPDGMQAFTAAVGDRIQVVGDDSLVTNASRIAVAAQRRDCNAVLIKPNQAGTITETLRAVEAARAAGLRTIVSGRSGETEDVTIVHLAVGWNAGQLKAGSFARSERTAKWNEALRIEAALGAGSRFAGAQALSLSASNPA